MSDSAAPVIGAYESRPAVCRDHDPRSADVARRVAALVTDRLPHVVVEHVGSTAVPGCAGKGIVDLMIPAADGEMDRVKDVLAELGFQPQTGDDPFPEERPMRVGSLTHDGDVFLLHVHVIPADSPEVDDLRFFRICLMSDPELQRTYVEKKRQIIAEGITDSLEYCREKGRFLQEILG